MSLPLNLYNDHKQEIRQVKWKPTARYAIMPRMVRPLNNGVASDLNQNNYIFPKRRPGPIKHWRLNHQDIGKSGVARVKFTEIPGGTIYLGEKEKCKTSDPDCESICKDCSGVLFVVDNQGYYDTHAKCKSKSCDVRKCCCNPPKNVIKSAVTLLGAKGEDGLRIPGTYSTTHQEYMRKRCLTFKQRQFNYKDDSHDKRNLGKGKANCCCCCDKADSCTPSSCPHKNNEKCRLDYAKPNNRRLLKDKHGDKGFYVQGAVSSSTRVEKLKLDTINKTNKEIKDKFGSHLLFRTSYQSDYSAKSKWYYCDPSLYHKNGNKNLKCGRNVPKYNAGCEKGAPISFERYKKVVKGVYPANKH